MRFTSKYMTYFFMSMDFRVQFLHEQKGFQQHLWAVNTGFRNSDDGLRNPVLLVTPERADMY